jgi:DNA-binding NtrC family response regulator
MLDIILLTHPTGPTNGLDVLRNIKRLDSNIYVLYILKQKDMKLVVDALRCGAFNCMVKGFNEEELLTSMVKNIVSLMELSKKGPTKGNSPTDGDKH